MQQTTNEQVVFTSAGKRLLGMLHYPRDRAHKAAVVCVYPLAEERKCAHRPFVLLARRLAADGIAVMRFDCAGCGDSEGDFRDVTMSSQLEDIQSAIDYIASRVTVPRIGLIGLRLGATLASLTATTRDDLALLVLWEPILRGAAYFMADVKRKLVREMMMGGKGRAKRSEILAGLERGEREIDMDGFVVGSKLYKELKEIDLPHQVGRFRGDVLIAQISFNRKVRDDTQAILDVYRAGGANATLAALVEQPFWNRIDYVECAEVIDTTARWVSNVAQVEAPDG